MTLKELRDVCKYCEIELHDGYKGKLVATTSKTLDKFNSVEVLSAYPKMKADKDGSWARPYLYVYGDYYTIEQIKKGGDDNA